MAGDLASLAASIAVEPPEGGGSDDGAELAAQAQLVVPGLAEAPKGDGPPLRQVLAGSGATTLLVLFALNLVDELDRIAFTVLAPDIRAAFDLSDAALLGINSLSGVLVILMALPFAALADRGRPFRRTQLAGGSGLLWSVFAFLTGVVTTAPLLGVVRFLSGFGKAAVDPVHGSLLADAYPVAARGRVYAAHQAANPLAGVVGPIFCGVVAYLAGWRWAFLLGAPFSIVAGLAALRLREPQRGQQEGARQEGDVQVPFATGFRRLLQIRSLRYVYFAIGVLGFGLVSGPALLSLHLERSLGLSEVERSIVFAILAATALSGVALGKAADRLFRHDPSWPLFVIGGCVVGYTAVGALALYLPGIAAQVLFTGIATALVSASPGIIRQMVAATAPPALRSLAFALLGLFIFLFGGFLGSLVLGGISDATSPRFAIATLVVPGIIAGALVCYGSRFVKGDIAMVVEDIAEAARATERRAAAASSALLEVRNLDFSYGPVQVLFGVDLDIPEGEIVALLGTNGAGKSTLLRAICGLDHPTRGSIRFDGDDITYLEAEQIITLGLSQMPGGKAVFPGMTVRENLQVGAFAFRGDKARIAEDIAQCEAWFPILEERADQLAATLSGGEQQMLALSKAFLTRPRLLCIDELSLGLAPTIVEQLLGIVRQIHARGTTVVVVEQSVNVALSLATTAVFMEKGQVRFSGPAPELLDRPDLLRSIFLEGATL